MPIPADIPIEDKTQNQITQSAFTAALVGNVYVEGHEEDMIQAIEHTMMMPTDLWNR